MSVNAKLSMEITGPALSFLYFAASTSNSTKEGFLLGAVEERRTEFITDEKVKEVKEEIIIRITGVHPCTKTSESFYQWNGKLDRETLSVILPPKDRGGVVGWFTSRYGSLDNPSARETYLQYQLIQELNVDNEKHFIFGLVQTSQSSKSLVQELKSKFYYYHNRTWASVPGCILNLNQNMSEANKNPYRKFPKIEPELMSVFLREIDNSSVSISDQKVLETIVNNGVRKLGEVLSQVSQLHKQITQMDEEINLLQHREAELALGKPSVMQSSHLSEDESSPEEFPSSPLIGQRKSKAFHQTVQPKVLNISTRFQNLENPQRSSPAPSSERLRMPSSSQEY